MSAPLVSGAERLYYALGKASKLASENEEWAYIRDRISELVDFYEEILRISSLTGWKRPQSIEAEVERLSSAVSAAEMASAAGAIIRLDRLLSTILPTYRALARYVSTSRIVASIIEIVAGLAIILMAQSITLALFGIVLAASGVAAGLLYRLRLSDAVLAVGGAASISALAFSPPEPVLLEAILAAAIGAFAASPLAYFLSTRVDRLAG